MPVGIRKAAIYARVSSEKQEKEKTIESQLAELREICKKDGVQIVKEYIDNGFSGSTLARPALDQLRDDASKGVFNIVYIHSPDRLARKYVYQALVIEELRKKDIEIRFLNKPLGDSPEDQLLLGVQGLIAEYEKAKLAERTRRGRLYKAKMGKIVGNPPPYGYHYIKNQNGDGHYVTNEKEAEVVKLIFNLYIRLGSVRAVAKELTRMRIKPRQGVHWRTSTLHKILRNETYIGTTYYNKSYGVEPKKSKKYIRRPKSSRRTRDRAEWIPIKVPAILNKQTFQLVQELLHKNHKNPKPSSTHYLLSGLIECGDCGSNYTGELSHGYRFYRCNNRHRRFPLPRNCKARMISANKMENAIWNAISQTIMKPQILIPHILHLAKNIAKSRETLEKEKVELTREKQTMENKKDKIIELYTEGAITKEQLTRKMQEYNQKEEKIEEKLRETKANLSQITHRPFLIKDILNFCKIASDHLKTINIQRKQSFLKLLIEKIIFQSHEGKAIIKAHIPLINKNLTNFAGMKSTASLDYGRYPKNLLRFELEVKVKCSSRTLL